MDGCMGLRGFTSRLVRLIGLKQKPQPQRRTLQISKPFNFKHVNASLPGYSEDEIAILKEKAAASRLGVAPEHEDDRLTSPRRAPAPPSMAGSTAPSVYVTHGPAASHDNLI
jgi:hypothetical protein